jgi:hypothetical protein
MDSSRHPPRRPELPEKWRGFTEEELRPRPPGRVADFAVGVVMLIVDAATVGAATVCLAMRGWGIAERNDPADHVSAGTIPPPHPQPPPSPPMDWTPTLTFAVITALVVLTAVGFARSRRPVSAWAQGVVALLLAVATIVTWQDDHRVAHPAKPHHVSATYDVPPCFSGSHTCH